MRFMVGLMGEAVTRSRRSAPRRPNGLSDAAGSEAPGFPKPDTKNIRLRRMLFMVGLMGIEPTAFPTPRERAADAPQPGLVSARRKSKAIPEIRQESR